MDNRFCPNCGSRNVEPDFRRTNVLGEMVADQNKWVCNDCNYTGWMPAEEEDSETADLEFDEQEQPEIDTSLGKGYGKYIFYVTIPVLTIYVLIKLI